MGVNNALRSYKTELKLTEDQKSKVNRTIGVCRFVHNLYVAHVKSVYATEGRFVNNYEFSKWLNNEYRELHPEHSWIREVSSKAVRTSIINGETAFKRFFKKQGSFPRFKRKGRDDPGVHLPRNSKTDIMVDRHRIKIPTFGWVRLKEKGYIPVNHEPRQLTITHKAGRYFVSVLFDIPEVLNTNTATTPGVGVDLGLKTFAVVSDGRVFKNVNKSKRVRRIERKLKREQRRLSRKLENKKKRGEKAATYSANVDKRTRIVQKIHTRLANVRVDHVNKVVHELVKTKPAFVTIEDLNVRGMMKNRHLAKAIAKQNFFNFRLKLTTKCRAMNIELRVVDRFYPSSRTCSGCGSVKKDLKLSDRVYVCPQCGLTVDRDLNAALNLANVKVYKVA